MPRASSKTSNPRPAAVTLSDREIWTGALHMIRRYGVDAANEARQRLDGFQSEEELDAQLAWLRIIEAIAWLQDDHAHRSGTVH